MRNLVGIVLCSWSPHQNQSVGTTEFLSGGLREEFASRLVQVMGRTLLHIVAVLGYPWSYWLLSGCCPELPETSCEKNKKASRTSKINNSGNNSCWWGCRERGTLLRCWWECKLVLLFWKTVWRFIKKLKIELPYDPAIALLGIYPKNKKNADAKGHMHPNVYSSTINNSQIMERTKMSIDWWVDKEMWHIYIYLWSRRMKSCHLQQCG